MNWTDVHAVLTHIKNVDMPKAFEELNEAKAELAAYTKQRGRKELQIKRAEASLKVERLHRMAEAISDSQIGDIVDDNE